MFDVVVPDPATPTVKYGISCKMRRELNRASSGDGRITMELSNSAKQFWQHLHRKGITEANYRDKPSEVGEGLIELVRTWHEAESHTTGGIIDLSRSYYLVEGVSELQTASEMVRETREPLLEPATRLTFCDWEMPSLCS